MQELQIADQAESNFCKKVSNFGSAVAAAVVPISAGCSLLAVDPGQSGASFEGQDLLSRVTSHVKSLLAAHVNSLTSIVTELLAPCTKSNFLFF